jgi:alkylhydroperoxidase family enzyme
METPMSRIPLVAPEELTPEQAEVWKSSPAGKLNLFRLLAHGKTVYPGFSRMTRAIFSELTLPPLEREVVILAVLRLERGEYEWAQHLQIAAAMGIAEPKVDALAAERFGDPIFDDREKALLAFTRQVVKAVRVDDFAFSAVAAFYDPRQIVEMLYVIGTYMMILRISEVAELEIDDILGASVLRHATSEPVSSQ